MIPKYYPGFSFKDILLSASGIFVDYSKVVTKKIRAMFNYKHALLLDSGRSCLDLTLKFLNLEKNSFVAIPVNMCEVVVETILRNKLKPLFIDIQNDLTMCAEDLEKKVKNNKNVKVIIPFNVYGNVYDEKKINSIAKKNKLILIDDKAQSINPQKNTFAVSSFISLDFAKYLSAIKGGILLTDSEELYTFAKQNSVKGDIGFKRLIELIMFMILTNNFIYAHVTNKIKKILKQQLFYKPMNKQLSAVGIALIYSQLKKLDKKIIQQNDTYKKLKIKLASKNVLNSAEKYNLHLIYVLKNKSVYQQLTHNKLIDFPEKTPLLNNLKKYKMFHNSCPNAGIVYSRVFLIQLHRKSSSEIDNIYKLLLN